MGNTLALEPSPRLGWQRFGVHAAQASEASRSGVDPEALWTNFSSASAAPDRGTNSPLPTTPCPPGRSDPTGIGFPQFSDQQAGKIDRLPFHAQPPEPPRIPHERLADKPLASVPFDLSIAPHPAHRPTARVAQGHTANPPGRRLIHLRWATLPQ